jgi:phospholipase C
MIRDQPALRRVAEEHLALTPADGVRAPSPASIAAGLADTRAAVHTVTHTVAQGNLPNVSFVDPAFNTEGNGTSADDHPLADIRLGERFIADAYHALASAGYLHNTVLIVTFDEWGGFYDHVLPPRVIDDTNPADVDHTRDGTTPTDGQLIPDYRQLGFRVPTILVSGLARRQVVHHGPFEHASTLKLIETTFGLHSLLRKPGAGTKIRMTCPKCGADGPPARPAGQHR